MMQAQLTKFAKISSNFICVYEKNCWRPGLCPGSHSNCCLFSYLNIDGVYRYDRVQENASGILESPGNFCNQESGDSEYVKCLAFDDRLLHNRRDPFLPARS